MGRLLLALLLILAGYASWMGDVANPVAHELRGPWLTVHGRGFELRFLRGVPFAETYEILSAEPASAQPRLENAAFMVVRVAPAAAVPAAGAAPQAPAPEPLRVLAGDGRVRRTLDQAHGRTGTGQPGRRDVCLHVEGQRLHLDVGPEQGPGAEEIRRGQDGLVYAQSATLVACPQPAAPGS